MEEELFDSLHRYGKRHWWFRGRRRVVFSLLDRYHRRREGRVLDLGCGVGTNLDELARYGEVWGADPSTKALDFCRTFFPGRLDEVWLPQKVPYADASFDLITMLDVLEHVEDDVGALQRVLRLLKPGGTLLLTVPALRWLWSQHDVEHHHFRRYHRGELRRKLLRLGFDVRFISYAMFLLLPAMGGARLLLRPQTWSARHLEPGTRGLAKPLEWIFSSERHLMRLAPLPIGGSLVAVARRPEDLVLEPWREGQPLPAKHE
ncbi:MAG: class I SAM-dependent methyltransferase [Planctomycetota bacterium]|nr:class I SAM-dependent methyltransferase [Planctomycetota bacterium]